MPDDYLTTIYKQRAALLKRDDIERRTLAQHWLATQHDLSSQLDQITKQVNDAKAKGTKISEAWLYKQTRLATLLQSVEQHVSDFADFTDDFLTDEQKWAVVRGANQARQLIKLAQGTPQGLIPPSFTKVHVGAVDDLIGKLQDGSPLKSLLHTLAPQAVQSVSQKLISGLVQGNNPKVVARQVKDDLGVSLTRAQTITRTEMIGSYRNANLRTYRANSDVVGSWQWVASLGSRTCPMCIAMSGRIFPITIDFASHPNCRCAPVPVTNSWASLGIDLPDTRPRLPTGDEWFEKQTETVQRKILGPGKFDLYRDGHLQLSDLIGEAHHDKWGDYRYERTLKQIRSGTNQASVPSAALPNAPAIIRPSENLPFAYRGFGGAVTDRQYIQDLLKKGYTRDDVVSHFQPAWRVYAKGILDKLGEVKPEPIKPIIKPEPVVEGKLKFRVHLSDGTTVDIESASEKTAGMRAYRLAKDKGLKVAKLEKLTSKVVEPEPIKPKPEPIKPEPTNGKLKFKVTLSDGSVHEIESASEQTAKMRSYKLAKEKGLKVTSVEPIEKIAPKPAPVVTPKPTIVDNTEKVSSKHAVYYNTDTEDYTLFKGSDRLNVDPKDVIQGSPDTVRIGAKAVNLKTGQSYIVTYDKIMVDDEAASNIAKKDIAKRLEINNKEAQILDQELTGKQAIKKIKELTGGTVKYLLSSKEEQTKIIEQIREEVLYLKVANNSEIGYNIKYNASTDTSAKPAMNGKVRKGFEAINKMVRITEQTSKNITVNDMGYSYRANAKKLAIQMATGDNVRTYVHELGHVLEANDPKMLARAQAFLAHRTQGEKAELLSKITGHKAYGPTEFAKKDDFFNPYIGKEYIGATEVHSMGLEYMWSDPVKFIEKDPNMFEFIFDSIRGRDVS